MRLIRFFLFFTSLFCLSCKKKYTCSCTTSVTSYSSNSGTYFTEVVPAEKKAYGAKMNKKQAKSACNHQREIIESNFINGYTGNNPQSLKNGESIVTTCNIIE